MQHIFLSILISLFVITSQQANCLIKCKSEICKAVHYGDLKRIEKLIKTNKRLVNHKENYGISMLHVAVMNEDDKTVDFLIGKGANVNSQDQGGATPLHIATRANFQNIAKTLLKTKNIDINIQDNEGYTPIMRAISTGRSEIVMLIIAKNPDCKIRNNQGKTMIDIPMSKIAKYAKDEISIYVNQCLER